MRVELDESRRQSVGRLLGHASRSIAAYGLPLLMAIANRSALATMCVCACLCIASEWVQAGSFRATVSKFLPRPSSEFFLVIAFVAVAALSYAWSIARRETAFGLGEMLIALVAGYVVVVGLTTYARGVLLNHVCLAMIICAAYIILDLHFDMAVRRLIGMRLETSQYNRGVETLAMYAAPVITALAIGPRQALLWIALAAVGAAALASESGAGVLALAAAGTTSLIARSNLTIARWIALIVALAALVTAPFIGEALRALNSDSLHRALSGAHVAERVDIWRAFGFLALKFLPFGSGFATSYQTTAQNFLMDAAPELRHLLLWHPHHALLQVWVELGLAGALLMGCIIWRVFRRVAELDREPQIAALTLLASIGSIALTAHSAWQGAWMAATAGAIAMSHMIWRSPDDGVRSNLRFS